MRKWTGTAIDVLFVISLLNVAFMVAAWAMGNDHSQLFCAICACFSLLLAVFLCVYPKGSGR